MIDPNTLSNLRKNYSLNELNENSVNSSPIRQFTIWFEEAIDSQITEPNAMILATSNEAGFPSARVVLLKSFDENGFVFFSNYESRKGKDIFQNMNVALLFFWAELERQIRIEGVASKISYDKSLEYFQSRPHESQIGAWCSPQSEVIPGRDFLEARFKKLSLEFERGKVPLPKNWGGYVIVPHSIEFWQGRPDRLHDRILYTKKIDQWSICRLAP